MLQKSQTTTWDGENPINNGIFIILGGWLTAFCPSTVWRFQLVSSFNLRTQQGHECRPWKRGHFRNFIWTNHQFLGDVCSFSAGIPPKTTQQPDWWEMFVSFQWGYPLIQCHVRTEISEHLRVKLSSPFFGHAPYNELSPNSHTNSPAAEFKKQSLHRWYSVFSGIILTWWFGLVVWILGIPKWKGLLLRGTPRIPNHQPEPPACH